MFLKTTVCCTDLRTLLTKVPTMSAEIPETQSADGPGLLTSLANIQSPLPGLIFLSFRYIMVQGVGVSIFQQWRRLDTRSRSASINTKTSAVRLIKFMSQRVQCRSRSYRRSAQTSEAAPQL